jgi:hypothetical protein
MMPMMNLCIEVSSDINKLIRYVIVEKYLMLI